MSELHAVAHKMVEKNRGILAADESTPTCTKRFESINTESTAESRNMYRNILFTAKDIEKYISGVILFDETFHQSELSSGLKIPEYLTSKDILPGIKVDQGLENFGSNEKLTKGLDGLSERLDGYYALGARFAKWRAVINIDDSIPSVSAMEANTHALGRYAALCQEAGIVPIVEPEVLMDGNHSIERCYEVTCQTLDILFDQLSRYNVMFEGIVLKPNMVISGILCTDQADVEKVADMTVKCFKQHVPENVGGIAFLSGGQSSDVATEHLNCMNKKYNDLPWNLTFSYGRALQQDALNAWAGSNRSEGQKELLKRAENNSKATLGNF